MASFIAKQVVGKKLDSVKGKQYFLCFFDFCDKFFRQRISPVCTLVVKRAFV